MSNPRLSVVMSVYNGESYLKAAIDSILTQTFRDFELILINDGSSDGTQKIIDSCKDPRIVKIEHENKGLVASLNIGVAKARGEFIARQDADDESLPTRLQKEVAWLDAHPGTVVVGTRAVEINGRGEPTGQLDYPTDDASLRLAILSYTPFAHGSIMFKKSAIEQAGGYRADAYPAEDVDLWHRLIILGKVANLPERLYKFRVNTEGISLSNVERQIVKIRSVRRQIFKDARLVLASPLTVRRALAKDNSPEYKKSTKLLLRVSVFRGRPLTTLFVLSSIILALPKFMKDN